MARPLVQPPSAVLVLLALALGCGDDSGDDGVRGRGSEACRDWQDAVCDFAADECRVIERAVCDDSYRSITCLSDERATECANVLNEAACGRAPGECDVSSIADPEPAQRACETLLARLCAHVVGCGRTTEQECMQQAAMNIDCGLAIGHTPNFEDCLTAVDGLSCDTAALPQVCHDVIKQQR